MIALQSTSPLSPDQHDTLLALLASPEHTLQDIARALSIPLSALLTYLHSPDGDALTTSLQDLVTARAQIAAASHLPRALAALASTLDDYDAHIRAGDATDHHHTRALRAASLILRISRPTPRPRSRRQNEQGDGDDGGSGGNGGERRNRAGRGAEEHSDPRPCTTPSLQSPRLQPEHTQRHHPARADRAGDIPPSHPARSTHAGVGAATPHASRAPP